VLAAINKAESDLSTGSKTGPHHQQGRQDAFIQAWPQLKSSPRMTWTL
jgi:hypothetical protein